MLNYAQQLAVHYQTTLYVIGAILGVAAMGATFFLLGRRSAGAGPELGNWKGRPETLFPIAIDKRQTARRAGKLVEVQYAAQSEPHAKKRGFILDRSMGGLGLILEEKLDEGARIVVLPSGASVHTPWVEMEVRNCRSDGDHWEVGCKFVQMPPYSTLVLFG